MLGSLTGLCRLHPVASFCIARLSGRQIGDKRTRALGISRIYRYSRRKHGYGLNFRRESANDLNAWLANQLAELLEAELGVAVRD